MAFVFGVMAASSLAGSMHLVFGSQSTNTAVALRLEFVGARPDALMPIFSAAIDCSSAKVSGLMLLPPAVDDPNDARPYFAAVRQLRDDLASRGVAASIRGLAHGLIDQYAGVEASRKLYTHWRGGYYYAAKPKGDASAPLGLFYISRWSHPQHAGEFAAIYAKSLWKRYKHVHGVAEGNVKPINDVNAIMDLEGRHVWLTEDGPIVVEVQHDMVLVTESLDEPTTESLERAFLTSKTN